MLKSRVLLIISVPVLLAMLLAPTALAETFDLFLPVVSSPTSIGEQTIQGLVESGGSGLAGYDVGLFAITPGPDGPALELDADTTDVDGNFTFTYQPPEVAQGEHAPLLFVKASKDWSMLAGAIGTSPVSGSVVVNERTTVATGFAFAQFINGAAISGNTYGMINAIHMAANLANPQTGEVGEVLAAAPNGPDTKTLKNFNSLANMVAACVHSWVGCYTLYDATTLQGEPGPVNSLDAVANIAKYSWLNTVTLYLLSLDMPLYTPARELPPDAWVLILRFTGTNSSVQSADDLMNGPGAFAIDEEGYLWVNDNYEPKAADQIACTGHRLLKFFPWGENYPGSPYTGGGLEGVGFGISLAPNGNVWVGNFGFEAPQCSEPDNPFGTPATHDSISEFTPDGVAVSPDVSGYTEGDISWPQSTVADPDGNIWVANCGNNSVTYYPGGSHADGFNISDVGLEKPFGLTIGANGMAWVVGNESNSLAVLDKDGSPLMTISGTDGPIQQLTHPMGIAADSQGNIWVANSDVVDAPCNPPARDFGDGEHPSVALLTPDGQFHPNSPFDGGGVLIPWGITVDGNDTVWVANFGVNPKYDDPEDIGDKGAPPRVSQFCGMDTSKCPPGKQEVGQAISPPNGYTSDALMRNTGISIDPSGNVWLANNWKEISVQNNPGGNSIAVMIGAAGPVKTPLIGLPKHFDN